MNPSSRRRAPDPAETIQELISKNPNLKDELAALKTMFDVREDRHNELIEDKERKIQDIGYKLANEISKTERQTEENAKLSQLVTTGEIRLGKEVFGHAETTSRLKLLEQQKDQLLSRLNVEQERILNFHVSENALKKERYDLVEQLREAKDLQDCQQAQIDSLKDAAKSSTLTIKTLENKLKGLHSSGNQLSAASRKQHIENISIQRDLPADTIEARSESAKHMPECIDEEGYSSDGNDEALDQATTAKRVGRDKRVGYVRKWNIALETIKKGRERMQLLGNWLQTNNKGYRWWQMVLTLIESPISVKQAVERVNMVVYQRRVMLGNDGLGVKKRLEVMLKDLETAVGVLTEELKRKDDLGGFVVHELSVEQLTEINMGYHPSGLLIPNSTNYIFPLMKDEQVNGRRKEKRVIEQDSEIAATAAKRTYAHVNEAPDPPRPQKRVRSGVLADWTRQVTPAERQTQHKAISNMNSNLIVLIDQDEFEERQTQKQRKIAEALVNFRYIKPEPTS